MKHDDVTPNFPRPQGRGHRVSSAIDIVAPHGQNHHKHGHASGRELAMSAPGQRRVTPASAALRVRRVHPGLSPSLDHMVVSPHTNATTPRVSRIRPARTNRSAHVGTYAKYAEQPLRREPQHIQQTPHVAVEPQEASCASPLAQEPVAQSYDEQVYLDAAGAEEAAYESPKRRFGGRRLMGYGLACAAVLLLVVGIGVNVRNIMATQQVRAQGAVRQNSAADAPNSEYSEEKPTEAAVRNYAVAPDLPKYVQIDEISVFSRVLRVGVNAKNGEIGVPGNIFDTAWYDGSAKPGEAGAVFIDGHVSGPTQDGVFKRLDRVKQGTKIAVTTGNNVRYTYTVAAVEQYDAHAIDMNRILGAYTAQKHGLVLMTCNGPFDKANQTFTKRLVVFAVQD